MIKEIKKLACFFTKYKETFVNNLLLVLEAMIRCCSASTPEIALQMTKITGKDYKTNDMRLYRFLHHKLFQIDDKLWRCYQNILFMMLTELNSIPSNNKIYLQIDFTSDSNDFLILFASMLIHDKAIPLYFSMRKYPVKKGMYDHIHMENAFMKELRHVLSKKYQYIVLADRGFGNPRFVKYCEDAGFNYIIRVKKETKNGWGNLAKLYIHQTWLLVSDFEGCTAQEIANIYAYRFKIEKLFQDLKSSGFDIEASKIEKYDRFKRMLFLCVLSYSIMLCIGIFTEKKLPKIKKNYPHLLDLSTAFSR